MRRLWKQWFGEPSQPPSAAPVSSAHVDTASPSADARPHQEPREAGSSIARSEAEYRRSIDALRARVVSDAPRLDGGIQGLSSCPMSRDEDGDEAHEFIHVDPPQDLPSAG